MQKFKDYLKRENLSKNTIDSYQSSVDLFFSRYDKITKDNLLSYKAFLVDSYKGKTINLRIQGINKYLEFIKKPNLKLKFVKVQQKTYLENVISDADYEFLKNKLWKDQNYEWYFVVRFLGATGARVSELIQFKYENIKRGYIDLYTKGGKIRRPNSFCISFQVLSADHDARSLPSAERTWKEIQNEFGRNLSTFISAQICEEFP